MRPHPVISALIIAVGSAALAFAVGFAVDAVGAGMPVASAAAALVVAAAFARWQVPGLLAFGLVVLMADTVAYWTGTDLRFIDEVAIALLIVTALIAHRQRLIIPRPGWREAALGVLFGAGIVSSLTNAVPLEVWVPGVVLLGKGFAFFYLVSSLEVRGAEVRRLGAATLAIGLFILALGIVELLAPPFAEGVLGVYPIDQRRGPLQVVNSWFTHPAIYAWLAGFLSLFLFARFIVLRQRWALALGLVVGAASILSGRRTPVISLVVSLVAGASRELTSRGIAWRIWGAIAAGAVLIAVVTLPLMGSFYQRTFEDYFGRPAYIAEIFDFDDRGRAKRIAQLQPRVALYAGSVAIAYDRFPLGAGVGRFGSQMSREVRSPVYREFKLHDVNGLRARRPIAVTDTFWPMILGETGVIGLLAAFAFFGLLFRDVWRAALPVGPPEVHAFALGALMIYVEALIRSAAAPAFVAPPIAYWVFGAVGLALALRASESEEGDEPVA